MNQRILPCPQCAVSLSIGPEALGQQVKCASCGHVFVATDNASTPYSMSLPGDEQEGGELAVRVMDGVAEGASKCFSNIGPFLLIGLIFMGIQLLVGILGAIPLIGALFSLANGFLLQPVMNAGMLRAGFKRHDGYEVEPGDVFAEFNSALQIVVLNILIGIITFLVMLIPLVIVIVPVVSMAIAADNNPNFEPEVWQIVMTIAGVLLVAIAAILAASVFVWGLPALIDRRQGFGDALSTTWKIWKLNPLRSLGTLLIVGLTAFSGVILCFVGVILTAPLASCMLVGVYRTAMPSRQAAPPPPTGYPGSFDSPPIA